MNMKQNPAREYQSTGTYSGVMYADPHSLITQMFDGALTRIAQAKGSMERGDLSKQGELISKAIQIIASLDACLDHEQGGELSANLANLYEYMIRILSEANMNNNINQLNEVIKLILEIKSAWVQIAPGEAQKAG